MFFLQADGAEFAPVLALLEFAFELPVALPGAGNGKRDAEFRKDSRKPAAKAGQMTRRSRVKIVGEGEIDQRQLEFPADDN